MGNLAESVLDYICRQGLLQAGDRAGVAVSGGADSVALLRLLLKLHREVGVVLSVVHFNHNLRGAESEADEQFVRQLARSHGLEMDCDRGDVARYAATRHLSTEAAARELRYRYFFELIRRERLSCIATGHTLDDQAETVLLRLVRGAGTRGLAGIYPRLVYPGPGRSLPDSSRLNPSSATVSQSSSCGSFPSDSPAAEFISDPMAIPGSRFRVIRPLLGTGRAELEAYLREIGQPWREDSSNRDLRHARNRVRHGIVPRLERTLNPRVKKALAETAEIAQAEEEYWQKEVERVLPAFWDAGRRRLSGLAGSPLALRRRVVRAVAESLGVRLEFRQVEEILGTGTGGSAMLSGGWTVSGNKAGWRFDPCPVGSGKAAATRDYEYVLAVPGMVQVPEVGTRFETAVVPVGALPGYNPDHVFDTALLQKELTVRNWRAGDRFWPAHRKSEKKVKELLQGRKLPEQERRLWPVVVSGGEIVWVRGFPAPARWRPREGAKEALVIKEHSKT